jgi:tetraacyldisaccharide 4'-kinase
MKEWEASGDEPLLISERLPGVPVVVGRDRGMAGATALSRFKTEVLILDDGFQHHRLGRDVDLVAIDADTDLDEPMLLPAGRLREPVSVLSLADAFVIVGGELSPSEYRKLETLAPGKLKFKANRVPRRLFVLGEGVFRPLSTLKDKEVGILCGIARPSSFRETVESLGATIVATRFYSDHYKYVKNDVRALAEKTPFWLTTEKDAVKLDPTWFRGVSISVLGIDLVFAEPLNFEKFLSEAVEEAISQKSLHPDRRGHAV